MNTPTVIAITVLSICTNITVQPARKATPLAFSTGYLRWGCIKSQGKQLQAAPPLTPALYKQSPTAPLQLVTCDQQARQLYPKAWFWMTAGPVLVYERKAVTPQAIRKLHPTLNLTSKTYRVALAKRKEQLVLILAKCNIPQLQRILQQQQAEWAVNLDGGSATVWITHSIRIRGRQSQLAMHIHPPPKR